MDYHPDVAHYLAAKLRLFRDLVAADGAAVISADHDCSQAVIDAARARNLRIVAVGRKADGAGEGIRLVEADIDGFAQELTLEHRGRKHAVRLPLVGEFQIENALVAAGPRDRHRQRARRRFSPRSNISKARRAGWSGSPSATARRSLSITRTSPTRWRRRCRRCGLTPNASSLWCSAPAATAMPGKRPLMGAIATEYADRVIVTDDNPRHENPDLIRSAILSAARGAKEIGDRAEAIRTGDCRSGAGRRAADRRQGPRDRTDRRQQHLCRSAITTRLLPHLHRGAHERDAVVDHDRDGGGDARLDQGALPEAISGLSIDSRTIAPGEAYFAIKGDVHDGHDFVAAALKAGAALAVVEAAQR